MLKGGKTMQRVYIGKDFVDVMDIPNLVDIQLTSYERFLQEDKIKKGQSLAKQGLEEVFQSIFPIQSTGPNGDMVLSYSGYNLDYKNIKFTEEDCKEKDSTYAVPLKATIDLSFRATGEIRQKEIYFGDIPLMTKRGTFVVNGAERVVVSQIHRSPGVVFAFEKDIYSARINPDKGSWLEFEIDSKKDLIYTKIDKKKRILGTLFLRALGFDTREKIIDVFYKRKTIIISDKTQKDEVAGVYLARNVLSEIEGESKKIYKAGSQLHAHDFEELQHLNISEIEVVDFGAEGSLNSVIIFNCFEREDAKYLKDNINYDEPTREDAVSAVYSVVMPGDAASIDDAERDIRSIFSSTRRYDLGKVGRYKLNKKFTYDDADDSSVLADRDITHTMNYLMKIYVGDEKVDDVDHLGNRRIRSVGELLSNSLKSAFLKMEKIARERMSQGGNESIKPQDLITMKPITAAINEFFGSSQLSQFMDQVNPLAEITHKRRLNALGPGGLSRERAGFEVRDVHYTHYGRMCPIETPEGPNIGLIVSLANFTQVNEYGFLETPYRKVENGKVTKDIQYLSAMDEDRYFIAQANAPITEKGEFENSSVICRNLGDYKIKSPTELQYMDVSPKQVISIATSLIPFLEHDDANRALMGSNMQRQAVPLVFPESPIVGTGMEYRTAYDSGVCIKASQDGVIEYASSSKIVLKFDKPVGDHLRDVYELKKYRRTNQDTCFNHNVTCVQGQKVKAGEILADGPSTDDGELALGRNVLVGFVPWNGFNFEDAILISERVAKEDIFTSVHIKEFTTEVRETKLGPETITRDIPHQKDSALSKLDEEGIIIVGSHVTSNDILVGKVTPKSETEPNAETKLLNSIFGEKAKNVRDNSLRLQHGSSGVVVGVQRLKRSQGDDLKTPGVEEIIKVLVATKRKLREGDKMAGRHGNKGVVSRILPIEDMPYMEDGTPLDICLNPLGVPSRMNLGQLLETELGWAGLKLGEKYNTPVFQSASVSQIEDKLEEAGLPRTSRVPLYDGRTGEKFENDVFCGCVYMLKLHHLVDDKMHARSIGTYSLVTQQPLGGKAQFGGQRLGEMEVWALEAYGASNTLQELMTIKSDDMNGRSKAYKAIVTGQPTGAVEVPESFNVLVQELRGLALDIRIFDSNGKQVALTERDEELINKQNTGGQF